MDGGPLAETSNTSLPPGKRQKTNSNGLDIGRTSSRNDESIPKYFVIKREEGDFSKVNPFVIAKIINESVGSVTNIKKVREGLLIETANRKQAENLIGLTRFGEFPVQVVPHSTLNYSKGVINCRDLLNSSINEIKEYLWDQGVIDAQRITIKKGEAIHNTASIILTFNKTKLPDRVHVAFYSLPVRHYIPAPLRCFRCQKFGHSSTSCQGEQICVCGKPLHVGVECETPIKCINCEGSHSTKSKNCPVYKYELAIQTLKVTKRLSYFEAKREVQVNSPHVNTSYARVVSKSTETPQVNIKELISMLIPEITKTIENLLVNKIKGTESRSEIVINKRKQNLVAKDNTTEIAKDNRKTNSQTSKEISRQLNKSSNQLLKTTNDSEHTTPASTADIIVHVEATPEVEVTKEAVTEKTGEMEFSEITESEEEIDQNLVDAARRLNKGRGRPKGAKNRNKSQHGHRNRK